MRTAFITGISGQDGYFLSQYLQSLGYRVCGLVRRKSQHDDCAWPGKKMEGIDLYYGDLSDQGSLLSALLESRPDEVYNLAAQSHVGISFKKPVYTCDITGTGAVRMMDATLRAQKILDQDIRFLQASSSEMFGDVVETPQTETTPFRPQSPYAVAKAYAHYAAVNFRKSYGMHISCSMCFNHESELRGEMFLTRKATLGAASVALGALDVLELGNLDAQRDWGHADDYVRAMHLMLQQDTPDDYVIATGVTKKVRDFVTLAFEQARIEIEWEGEGIEEVARVINATYEMERLGLKNGKVVVKINPEFYRPAEVNYLQGSASKARQVLGWKPRYSLQDLVATMVESDFAHVRRQMRLTNGTIAN